MDTIFARATPPGRSGVAIIRISGPRALEVPSLFETAPISPRKPALRTLRQDGAILDEALLLAFSDGQSFTGEPVLEIQCHGSIAVVNALLTRLETFEGLRPAEAGEFTRRALQNERLDLPQVEALADLIDAETEMQRQQALRGVSGQFSAQAEGWRSQLIRAAALLEATIDFADEEVPVDVTPEVLGILTSLQSDFQAAIAAVPFAERVRQGFEVAIVGAPNVGKSTLLNALAGREAALTSEIAGTTRDVVEVRMDLGGLPVTLLDTAGVREGQDPVERAGITLARKRAEGADLRIFLGPPPDGMQPDLEDILAHPKADVDNLDDKLSISGKTGLGLDALIATIQARLSARQPVDPGATHSRHATAIRRARAALESAQTRLEYGNDFPELAAQDMREALLSLDGLLGRIGVEDLLGEIFSSFCIGK